MANEAIQKIITISLAIKENQEAIVLISMITFLRMNTVENGAKNCFQLG